MNAREKIQLHAGWIALQAEQCSTLIRATQWWSSHCASGKLEVSNGRPVRVTLIGSNHIGSNVRRMKRSCAMPRARSGPTPGMRHGTNRDTHQQQFGHSCLGSGNSGSIDNDIASRISGVPSNSGRYAVQFRQEACRHAPRQSPPQCRCERLPLVRPACRCQHLPRLPDSSHEPKRWQSLLEHP